MVVVDERRLSEGENPASLSTNPVKVNFLENSVNRIYLFFVPIAIDSQQLGPIKLVVVRILISVIGNTKQNGTQNSIIFR